MSKEKQNKKGKKKVSIMYQFCINYASILASLAGSQAGPAVQFMTGIQLILQQRFGVL